MDRKRKARERDSNDEEQPRSRRRFTSEIITDVTFHKPATNPPTSVIDQFRPENISRLFRKYNSEWEVDPDERHLTQEEFTDMVEELNTTKISIIHDEGMRRIRHGELPFDIPGELHFTRLGRLPLFIPLQKLTYRSQTHKQSPSEIQQYVDRFIQTGRDPIKMCRFIPTSKGSINVCGFIQTSSISVSQLTCISAINTHADATASNKRPIHSIHIRARQALLTAFRDPRLDCSGNSSPCHYTCYQNSATLVACRAELPTRQYTHDDPHSRLDLASPHSTSAIPRNLAVVPATPSPSPSA